MTEGVPTKPLGGVVGVVALSIGELRLLLRPHLTA